MIRAILDKNLKIDDVEVKKVDGQYYVVSINEETGEIVFTAKGTE
jgi:hypothetical protein